MENQGARSQFAGGSQFKENSRNSNEASGAAISDSIARGKDAVGAASKDAKESAGSDLQAIRNDLNHLKDTLARFMSQASSEAVKSAREVTSTVAGQVSDVASDLANRGSQLASSAGEQAKTFATELESMARRNPLGALAGAVAVGVLIGIMGRRS
jgi:ElaB/YqjD/DUF883 family membrane-anchored ribosome-binding protein